MALFSNLYIYCSVNSRFVFKQIKRLQDNEKEKTEIVQICLVWFDRNEIRSQKKKNYRALTHELNGKWIIKAWSWIWEREEKIRGKICALLWHDLLRLDLNNWYGAAIDESERHNWQLPSQPVSILMLVHLAVTELSRAILHNTITFHSNRIDDQIE